MKEQTRNLRQLVRAVRDAQTLRRIALHHLQAAEENTDGQAIDAARHTVDYASGEVTRLTENLLEFVGYRSIDALVTDISSINTDKLESLQQQFYVRGQREALEGVLAFAEDELGEL